MKQKLKNYAFIDRQNLNMGIRLLGWKLDYRKLWIYLREKYKAERAYVFLGYIPENKSLYKNLKRYGYSLIFKPVLKKKDGTVLGLGLVDFYFLPHLNNPCSASRVEANLKEAMKEIIRKTYVLDD
jgi:hypothetical protein